MSVLPDHRLLASPFRLHAGLGMRFVDVATRQLVEDGLIVRARPAADPNRWIAATLTRGGAFAFPHLPGLADFEFDSNDDPWTNPAQLPFVIAVDDSQNRFLPMRFAAHAPHRGWFVKTDARLFDDALTASPPRPRAIPEAIPLFPAPGRDIPSGFAVLRAHVELNTTPRANAVAALGTVVVEIPRRPPVIRHGMTDASGRLTILFPWPEPANFDLGSPPRRLVLNEQTWTVRLEVRHVVESSPPDSPFAVTSDERLDLDHALGLLDVPPGRLRRQSPGPGQPLREFDTATLQFGRELIVPPLADGELRPRESLFITPAA